MRALVTGGGGFIGSHVVRLLLAEGVDVRVLHLLKEDLRNIAGMDVERIVGDITDPAAVANAVRGCDWVFHLAAIYALWLPKPELMRKVNVEGARNVLRAAGEAGAKKVVYTSSIAAFGGQGIDEDATEDSPFAYAATGEAYAISKYEGTLVAREFAKNGLDVSIVAPTGPVGPGDVGPTPTGKLILATVEMPFVPLIENNTNWGDVRDIAAGHILAAKKGRKGESYLLGSKNLSLSEFSEIVMNITGVRKPVIRIPRTVAMAAAHLDLIMSEYVTRKPPRITPAGVKVNAMGLRADCSKAVRELGLPQTPLETAIRDSLVWFARNGYIRNPSILRNLQHNR
ncbi:MAG: NAD-dependent epimerase/dehydratase family protein [Nitrospirae bacterium]|nr:NAD-dependent epimerase/dehydratase family protein [Nitrospirota bacterium]